MPKSNIIKLDNSNPGIKLLCNRDKRLAKVISMVGDITYQPYSDPFSFVVHEIIEQMLSIKAGKKIYSRLMDLCEGTITPEKISKLTDTEIKSIGTANSKVTYIRGFTNAVIAGEVNLNELAELPDEIVFE